MKNDVVDEIRGRVDAVIRLGNLDLSAESKNGRCYPQDKIITLVLASIDA